MRMTRREWLESSARVALLLPGGAAILAACSDDGSPAGPARPTTTSGPEPATTTSAVSEVTVTVELGEYPLWPNPAIVEDRPSLDALAAAYVHALGGGETPDMPRFLYGRVAVAAFDAVFAGRAPETTSTLWQFWVSGYFGGVWLRSEIDRAQPGTSTIGGIETAPTEDAFLVIAGAANDALVAIDAGGEELVSYCDAALLPSEGGGGGFVNGLVENFGYNQGYMLQILEQPPEGLVTPDTYQIECRGTLSCTYASPKLDALADLVARATGDDYDTRRTAFADVEDGAIARGRAVWSGGLSVAGFPQRSYEQLLDVSSSYLETVHATTLACLITSVEADSELGARAALANACMNVWLAGYQTGLLEGREYAEPRFVIM
jgi:hypothetical protein